MIYRFNNISIDTTRYIISNGDKKISVEPLVFDLLLYLVEHRDRVISHDEILGALWQKKVVSDSALTVQIKKARHSIGDSGRAQNSIKTVHGRGYQFIASVEIEKNDIGQTPDLTNEFLLPGLPSIAVQNFKIIGETKSDTPLGAAITEELLSGLSKYKDITTICQHSTQLAAEEFSDPKSISRELNVRYLLTGSVQILKPKIRLTATLIDGVTGHQIWSEIYKELLLDLFEIQDKLTTRILNAIVTKIERYDRKQSAQKQTSSLSAYEYVLLGRYYFKDWKCDCENMYKSREMYEKAIALDPDYASAYAGLAATYSRDYYIACSDNTDVVTRRCTEFARKAIELDPDNYMGHHVHSHVCWLVESDFDRAKASLNKAINLNPNYYWNYCTGCWFSLCNGDYKDSLYRAREAITRNPLLPDECLCVLALTFYVIADYESAIFYTCQMNSPTEDCYALLAASYAQVDKRSEAMNAVSKYTAFNNSKMKSIDEWSDYWYAYYKFKNKAPLKHIIEGLKKANLVISEDTPIAD